VCVYLRRSGPDAFGDRAKSIQPFKNEPTSTDHPQTVAVTNTSPAQPPPASLQFELLPPGILIVVQGELPPSAANWEAFVNAVRGHDGELRFFVYTQGWHPSRAQVSQFTHALQGRQPTVAIVSPLTSMAFVVSALALAIRRMRFFGTEEIAAAFTHLGLSSDEAGAARDRLKHLRDVVS
jgi:hypothetical protein